MRHRDLPAYPWLLSMGTCLFALALTRYAREPEHLPWQCNDNFVCDLNENQQARPSDCMSSEAAGEGAGAAVRDAKENWTFVEACLDTCGNGQEDAGKTEETPPRLPGARLRRRGLRRG